MAILDYTTKVPVHATVGEIQGILVGHGAQKIMLDYTAGHIDAITFSIATPRGLRGVRLPANAAGVQRALERDRKRADQEQAERVAWRIVKDWLEAQMAILDADMVEVDEIFLPYMLDRSGERTMFEAYKANQLMIEGGRQ